MKKFFLKSGIAGLTAFIFFNIVICCMSGGNRLEYGNVAEMAEKNAELVKPIMNPPGQSYGTADESLLKNDDEPFTAEDFSYMVIDGIRIDMPCTLGDLEEYFDIRYLVDEESVSGFIGKDGISFMQVVCDRNSSQPPYSDCVAEHVRLRLSWAHNNAFAPEIIVGGIDITADFDTRVFKSQSAGNGEYAFVKEALNFETKEDGYIRVMRGSMPDIYYYDNADELSGYALDDTAFELLTKQIFLSDTYDPEGYVPISLEGLDLSEMNVEIRENPDTCIYDELLYYQKNGQEAWVEIDNYEQYSNDLVYLKGTVYHYDEGNKAALGTVKAMLHDGQELGEALVLELE